MSYVGIKRAFHGEGDGLSFQGLGAAAASDVDVQIDYYASARDLNWTNAKMRTMHDRLVQIDRDWQSALAVLADKLDEVPDFGNKDLVDLKRSVHAFQQYPCPNIAEIALILEMIGGSRPFDQSAVSALVFAKERLLGTSAALAGFSAAAGLVGGIFLAVPADFGISGSTLVGLSAGLGLAAGTMALIGSICASLADGKLPKDSDVEMAVGIGAAATGVSPPSSADRASALATVEERQAEDERERSRAAAIEKAKGKSIAKKRACASRGGVFDPNAPDGCRIVNASRAKAQLDKLGIAVDAPGKKSLLVPAGLAALGVVGIYILWPKKPRTNPSKPKRRRKRRSH